MHFSPEKFQVFECFLKGDKSCEEKIKEATSGLDEIERGEEDLFLKWLQENVELEFSEEDKLGTKFIEKNPSQESLPGIIVSLDYILFWLVKTWKNSW